MAGSPAHLPQIRCAADAGRGHHRLRPHRRLVRRADFGIEPDTITTAKALTSGYQPLSALLVGDRIAGTLVEKGGEFYHGYTYSGHPVACAVALKNLEIMEREGLVDRPRTAQLRALCKCCVLHARVGWRGAGPGCAGASSRHGDVVLRRDPPAVRRRSAVGQPEGPAPEDLAAPRPARARGLDAVADLADFAGLDASTVSRHVRALEDDGLVARDTDPDDRRAASVRITDRGRAFVREALQLRARIIADATADWSDARPRTARRPDGSPGQRRSTRTHRTHATR